MAATACRTVTPFFVMRSSWSSSRACERPTSRSSRFLNLMEIIPCPPRPLGWNASTRTRLPYPPLVTASSISPPRSPPASPPRTMASAGRSPTRTTSMSAISSPSRSRIDLTPLEARPEARSCLASVLKRSAWPSRDAMMTVSASVHTAACVRQSPSPSDAAMSPRAVIRSKASSGVRLIQPCRVSSTSDSFSLNSNTGSSCAIDSSAAIGSSDCSSTPRAVRDATGTRNASSA
mmetsp:Transcript_203/g.684  ORF Transcript_203/g.684 Transcript_203/m.684 type:complete len:234 (+) Transcript_203:288-989(+)